MQVLCVSNCVKITWVEMTTFAERLSELISDKDITLIELSRATKINSSAIYSWVNHNRLPTLKTLTVLAEYFEGTLDFVAGRTEASQKFIKKSAPPFSTMLKNFMDNHNINMTELSKGTGINRTLIYKWFDGDNIPSVENLIRLANYFKCSLDELVGLE